MQPTHSCTFVLSHGGFFSRQRQQNAKVFENYKINANVIKDFSEHNTKIYCGLQCINDKSNVCAIHKCKVPECYEHVKNNDYYCFHDKDQSDYCVKHTCHSGDICWNLCTNGNFCLEHKCFVCDNELVHSTKFCKEHLTEIKCYKDGCTKYIQLTNPRPEHISYVQYCSEHACVNCKENEKINDLDICHRCKCKYEGCVRVKTNKMCYAQQSCAYRAEHCSACYCDEHSKMICFYGKYDKCNQLQCSDSKYCVHHKCKFPECMKHIYEYSDEDGGYHSDYCYKHDCLNKLCKRYFFDLEDKEIRQMIDSERVKYEIIPKDCISQLSTKDELVEHIKFNMAIFAIKICET